MLKNYGLDVRQVFSEMMLEDAHRSERVQNIYNPENFDRSITILTSYRTGSTAFCDALAQALHYENYDEAFHDAVPDRTQRFLLRQPNDRWVVKIMSNQARLHNWQQIQQAMQESYVIRLTRHDVVGQIASYYICSHTQNWHYQTGVDQNSYTVSINKELIEISTSYILESNYRLSQFDSPIDAEISYEELDTLKSRYEKYHKPANYDEVLAEVKAHYERKLCLKILALTSNDYS